MANAQQKNAEMRIAALDQRLTSVIGEVASLRTSIDSLIAFFGVTIPAWSNKDEVENGDEMGMNGLSAAELGIPVVFEFVRQQPGFGHDDVVSIDPPAGTLIAARKHSKGDVESTWLEQSLKESSPLRPSNKACSGLGGTLPFFELVLNESLFLFVNWFSRPTATAPLSGQPFIAATRYDR